MELTVITANTGKIFRRKADGFIYGKQIYLGYTYYINGNILDTPHLDTIDDFEEIDEETKETSQC